MQTTATTPNQPDPAVRAASLANLNALADATLAADRAYTTTLLPDAVRAAAADAHPLRPATRTLPWLPVACPAHAWCTGHEHGEQVTAASEHRSDTHQTSTGVLAVCLNEGVPSVAYTPDSGNIVFLAPDEALEQAAALIEFARAARSVAA